jgi:phasin family protein
MVKATSAQDSAMQQNIEVLMTLSAAGLTGIERLSTLNLSLAKTLFDDGVENSRTFADMKDINDMTNMTTVFNSKATEQFMDYFRGVQQINADLQERVFAIMNQQMAAFGGGAATPNPMLEIFTKLAEQAADMTAANLKTISQGIDAGTEASEPAATAVSKAKKTA